MHIIQNYTLKKILPLVMALLQGIKKERSFIFSTTAHTDKRYSSWIIQNYITYIWQKSWLIRICSALCLLMTWTARATAFHFSGSSGTTCTRTSFKNSIADSPTRRYGESAIFFGLKGHGNEADFLGFLQKLGPHRSLTLPFEPFRFWLRIRGDIRNRKTTPRLGKSGSRLLNV